MPTLKGKSKAKERKKKTANRRKKFEEYKKRMIAKIRLFDDPILKKHCFEVQHVELNQGRRETGDLGRVLAVTDNGVGLAAPQIGYTKRVIALRPNGIGSEISFMINPEIIEHQRK